MKIIVLKAFYDREAGMTLRTPGEVFEADEKRAVFLIDRGLVKEVKEKEEEKEKEEAKEKEKEKEKKPEKEEPKKEASKTPAKKTRKKTAPEE